MTASLEQQDMVYALTQVAGVIYAARASGLYRSNDGTTWKNALASLEENSVAMTDVSTVEDQLFAATKGGIFKLMDGDNWQVVAFRNPLPSFSVITSSVHFVKNKTLLAASLEDGVFRSEDEGKSWTAWNIGLFDLRVLSLAVTQSDRVYAGTETGLYISHNGGCSWDVVVLPFSHDAILSLFAIKNCLYVGTENHGLYQLKDNVWTGLELPPGAVNQILFLPDDALLILLDDTVCLGKKVFKPWRAHTEVTSIALSPSNHVLLGFASGDVSVEEL